MKADKHTELEKCDWGIRWCQARIKLGSRWNLPWAVEHAEQEMDHWHRRQSDLFDKAERES